MNLPEATASGRLRLFAEISIFQIRQACYDCRETGALSPFVVTSCTAPTELIPANLLGLLLSDGQGGGCPISDLLISLRRW